MLNYRMMHCKNYHIFLTISGINTDNFAEDEYIPPAHLKSDAEITNKF